MKLNMRPTVKALVAAAALLVSAAAFGQNKTTTAKDTTVNRKVQIEKDYEPEIGTHKRANIDLVVEKPKVEPAQTEYSHYTISMKPEQQATTINATKPCDTTLNHETPRKGFARLGFGPYWVEMFDFWYPILNSKEGYFDVGVHHNGELQPANDKHEAKHYLNTGIDINFNKSFNPGTLYLNLGYQNEWFNYYGDNDLGPDSYQYVNVENQPIYRNQLMPAHQSLNRIAFTLGMRSNGLLPSNWFYDASLAYNVLTTANRLQEHQIRGDVNTGMMVGMHRLNINLTMLGILYGSQSWEGQTPLTEVFYPTNHSNNGVVTFAPSYQMHWKNLNVNLGVKANFAFVQHRPIAVSPDVKIDYTVSDIVNFFGGITGDYQIHSLWNMLNENRYYAVENAAYNNTYIPIDAFVGFKLKPIKGLNITADFHYEMMKDAAFYRNNDYLGVDNIYHYSNNFVADHADANLFTIGVKASYNYNERFLVYAAMRYNKWQVNDSLVLAWHKPTWEFALGAQARIYKGLSANIDFVYHSPSKNNLGRNINEQSLVEVGPMYDLNLGVDYQFERNWSLFLQLNNLVAIGGINYQPWYGYNTIGFNAMVGAKVRF